MSLMGAIKKRLTGRSGGDGRSVAHRSGPPRGVPAPDSITKAFRHLRAEYEMGRDSRFMPRMRGVRTTGSAADFHYKIEAQFFRMLERGRDYDRNNMIVGQAISRLVNNVLQDGVKLDAQTGDAEVDAKIARLWNAWRMEPDACDLAGEADLQQMAKLSLRHVIVDGDVVHLPTRGGRLQAVEAQRLRTPRELRGRVIHGVELSEDRRRIGYFFTTDDVDVNKQPRLTDMRRIAARSADGSRQVFHIYNPKRFTQSRGVSALAPIVFPVGMHDDLQFANLLRAQVAACYAVFRERDAEFGGRGDEDRRGSQTVDTFADGSSRTLEGISPGMEIVGSPGEKLVGFSPNIPNPEFFQHASLILSIIAINLGLPVQVLLLDPTRTNFSGWRGAIDQARIGFREIQDWMVAKFYRPVYLWKLSQWVQDDVDGLRTDATRLDGTGGDVMGHRWGRPTWPYIEPLKDAQADTLRIKSGLISPRRMHAERGRDYNEVFRELIEDRSLLISAAIEEAQRINARNPEAAVDWRELAGFDSKGRKPENKRRVMEEIARGVRSGVPIAESEARVALGLPPEPPDGEDLLRFNDQDILQFHIENAMVKRSQVKERLNLPVEPEDDVYILRSGLEVVPAGSSESDGSESAADAAEEDPNQRETANETA
ncbi:MAG: phage portal protein [Phycisphaerae bacterium]